MGRLFSSLLERRRRRKKKRMRKSLGVVVPYTKPPKPRRRLLHHQPKSSDDGDRLSQLPESLQVDIISRLPELSEAVRTSVLSSQWKHLWKYVHTIRLLYPNAQLAATLSRQLLGGVTNFSFYFGRELSSDFHLVDELIESALSRNLKVLSIGVSDGWLDYVVCKWFCKSSSLESVSIEGFRHFQVSVVRWTCLKNLCLRYVHVLEDDIAKLLSGCPVLQCLSLLNIRISTKRLDTIWELDIVSPTVKTLWIGAVVNETSKPRTYYLNAPWLEYLHHQRGFPNEVLVLNKVSSLLKASLTAGSLLKASLSAGYKMDLQMHGSFRKHNIMLVESLQHVEDLVLDSNFINVLSLLAHDKTTTLFKCRHLTVILHVVRHDEYLAIVNSLFQMSPYVETLVMKVEHHLRLIKSRYGTLEICDADYAANLRMPKVNFPCLKRLKISHTFICGYIECRNPHLHAPWKTMVPYFKLVACIMRDAPFLKEVVMKEVVARVFTSEKCGRCAPNYLSHISREFFQLIGEWFDYDGNWKMIVNTHSSEIICLRDFFEN